MAQQPARSLIPFSMDLAMNDDMLTEILLRLPAKSLTRFKSVCKKWRSLISSDYFCHHHTLRRPKPQPSLLLVTFYPFKNFYFNGEKTIIPINGGKDLISSSLPNHHHEIVQACNGLLLLKLFGPIPNQDLKDMNNMIIHIYHVYNPTTRQSREISLSSHNDDEYPHVEAVSLAFDPSESPFYKIVCIKSSARRDSFQIEVLDSESHSWKVSLNAFTCPSTFVFSIGGVYWNNSIYWYVDAETEYFCFDIVKNEMKMFHLPRIDIPHPHNSRGTDRYLVHHSYLQESNGHLYYYEWGVICNDGGEYDELMAVWELREDHRPPQWLFKDHYVLENFNRCVMSLIGGDETFGLLTCGGDWKMMAYNFLQKTCETDLFHFKNCSDVSGYHFGEILAVV